MPLLLFMIQVFIKKYDKFSWNKIARNFSSTTEERWVFLFLLHSLLTEILNLSIEKKSKHGN